MQIKKGDNVIVIAGNDRGKKGKVVKIMPKENKALIEGVNVKKKHQKPKKRGEKGQVIQVPAPMHISNIMLFDKENGKRTRVGRKLIGGKMIRISKKSGVEI